MLHHIIGTFHTSTVDKKDIFYIHKVALFDAIRAGYGLYPAPPMYCRYLFTPLQMIQAAESNVDVLRLNWILLVDDRFERLESGSQRGFFYKHFYFPNRISNRMLSIHQIFSY